MSEHSFSLVDYVIFVLMLCVSGLIGVFFGCFGSKQRTNDEYILGGKSMNVIPVAVSLAASAISCYMILAIPADGYVYGTPFIWATVSVITISLVTVYIVMPVFLELDLLSTNYYLELRFDIAVKRLASCMYTLQLILSHPIMIYLPCLALAQVTGYNVEIISTIMSALCVFYTTFGGFKAVVWTDTFQGVLIFVPAIVVLIIGINHSGGLVEVFKIADEGERLNLLNFDVDPTVRSNFWSILIGLTAFWVSDVVLHQSTLHRLRAVSSYNKAKLVMVIFCFLGILIQIVISLMGIILYARYADCDPLKAGQIEHIDQIVPYYVMDVGGSIPGFPGLLVASAMAAALSTLSTNLLNIATTIYTDLLPIFIPSTISDNTSWILKIIVVTTGLICTSLIFVIGKFGGMFELTSCLTGITLGTRLGLFTLGMVFPISNSHGALYGGISGVIFSACMIGGNLWYKYEGLLPDYSKPVSIRGCNGTAFMSRNISTILPDVSVPEELPSVFFRISFFYYPLFGCFVVLGVGLLVSALTRKNNGYLRPELISPAFRCFLSRKGSHRSSSFRSVNREIIL